MPEILYKYKPLNGYTMEIIEDGDIYFPSMSELNDPFEGSIPFILDETELTPENIFQKMYAMAQEEYPEYTEEDLVQYVNEYQEKGLLFDENHIKNTRKTEQEFIEETFGIYCLTTENNTKLMWTHYADSHKGICIGFDTEILFNTVRGVLSPVIYQDDFPKYSLFETTTQSFLRSFATKSNDWEYENEYRLVKMNAAHETFTIPLEGIVEVIFGCKMPKDEKDDLIATISTNNPKCRMYEVKRSDKTFELDILPINE